MIVGIYLGARVGDRVSKPQARKLALFLATAGGVSALVRGLIGMIG
jgi:uncharacterized membrane protein YfcA